jgi:hypothetical protein
MSTAVRKQDASLPDPEQTETGQIVRLETATETMMAYIGYLNTQIHTEEDQPKPNQAKIKALTEQKNAVLDERHAITPDNEDLIARALYIYAPIMKAFYASHG